MILTSVLPFLVPGIISTMVNNKKQQEQDLLRMQQIQSMTKATSCSSENYDNEKKRFFETIKSLYKEAEFDDIVNVGNCFVYDVSDTIAISYNVKSPYLVVQAIANPEGLFPIEDLKERIFSDCKESKGIYINMEEKESRIIQIAIPVSTVKQTDSLMAIMDIIEDTLH